VTYLTRDLLIEAQQRLGLSDRQIAQGYGVSLSAWRRYRTEATSTYHRSPPAEVLISVLIDAGMLVRGKPAPLRPRLIADRQADADGG